MKKKSNENLKWYFILFIVISMFITLFYYQRNEQITLLESGMKTIGHFSLKENSFFDFKQNQKGIWSYTINGRRYSQLRSTANKIEDNEFYTVYYNPENEEDFEIAYGEFELIGKFANTKSLKVKRSYLNEDRINFEYIVNGKQFERVQSLKSEFKFETQNNYLVKYKVENPKIAYIFLDSIR